MRTKFLLAVAFMGAAFCLVQDVFAQPILPQPGAYQQKIKSAVLLFMENKGQVADDKGDPQPNILFTASSGGANIYLTATGIHYQFSKTDYPEVYYRSAKRLQKDEKQKTELQKQIKTSTHRFTVELNGANLQSAVSKQGQSNYTENYYLAQCPNGITGVHGYERLTFKNIYPNIDWVVYSKGGFMEYDFLVHPGGNLASIKLKIKDADVVSITAQGELLMKTGLGEVKEKAPVSYVDGSVIASRFKQNSDGTIGFDVQPQPGKELRIDPSIVWSTYYGGNSGEQATSSAIDKAGNVFLAGYTNSTTGVAAGGYQNTSAGGIDGFIVKFNSNGSRLWATYYGGTGTDIVYSSVVDGTGNLYFSGRTNSISGIASGGYQNTIGGNDDGFLVKLNASGTKLWSTYYGGTGYEYGYSCAIDRTGNVYLSGNTTSATGISFNGHQNTPGGSSNYEDAFLVKFSSSGSRLWATYYGGSNDEEGRSCTVDNNNNVFLSGSTKSTSNIAFNGHQNTWTRDYDAYLVKFDSSGTRLWGTYYGSLGIDEAYSCATDNAGNVYLSGETDSTNGIAFNGYQNSFAGQFDAFLVKFNPAGTRQWGTYYGGNEEEFGYACCVDSAGNVYMAGETNSLSGIAFNGVQDTYGGSYNDAFLVKFNSAGARQWGTYYGGSDQDFSLACSAGNNYVFLTGTTRSLSGIASSGYQNTLSGSNDAFLAKISVGPFTSILCPNSSVSIISPITGSTYQWEISPDGIIWTNVAGATTQALQLNNIPSSSYGYQYRCRVDGTTYTDPYQLKFETRWIGTTNSAWENPANWSCGILPDGNTDVIINSGPVVLSLNGICRTLTVRPGVSFTVTTGNTLTITH